MSRHYLRCLLFNLGTAWLLVSCATASLKFKDEFNPEYHARDRGGINATVTGKACSMIAETAQDAAKKAADYHLRSLLGNERYRTDFKLVRKFREGDKVCFVIQGRARQL